MASGGSSSFDRGATAGSFAVPQFTLSSMDAGAQAGIVGTVGASAGLPAPTAALPPRRVEDMSSQEIIQMLPAEDQYAIARVASQGRWTGLFTAAATGAWVFRALRRRGAPMPAAGAVLLGLTLGYPLGVSLTVAYNGRLLKRVSTDILELQRRSREAYTGSAAGYESTFPGWTNPQSQQAPWTRPSSGQQQGPQTNWSDTSLASGNFGDASSGLMNDRWSEGDSTNKSTKDEILKE
ncbi:hypothetical protein BESB_000840 [Besnoitia besnoiti]|uniref:Transmembrane protein n=1 Tax=Besnoitia besnoiti TaxID=94643 RepID=A0A2A9MPK1_BESBE|nr:hypothetical protein BESB_000840 [Besnoitia besnoiti]PFH37742.1 hypothetical protein BESB_000840 [Besnoitia besnoiti]